MSASRPLPPAPTRAWFDRPAAILAPALLGARLIHDSPAGRVGGRIVEVEAYSGPEDLAAHSARGKTARNAVVFGPPGFLYVYLIYGLHHCINVVSGPGAKPEAVLIRALDLDEGLELARVRRGARAKRLASGPGNVGQALGINRSLNGSDLLSGPVRIELGEQPAHISSGPRIGIDYAGDWKMRTLRFWASNDLHVSR